MSSSSPIEHKGKLKIFLGYAAGVGKTYQMLEEAREQQLRGVDVVVGYFEPHARPDTIAKLDGLSVLPRREVEYRGTRFEEMDTGAILARHPQLCVVDEFPHTNVPGSERPKRWQDILVLLDAGIDVYTTMNVQHLESLNDQVDKITGIRVRETIPDWVVQQADDVVMVDLTPRALLNRLERGVVYQGEKAQQAKLNFFKESTLVALRELALRETAFEVEAAARPSVKSAERILVYITSGPSAQSLIRRGKRVADYLNGECLAVAFSIEEGPPAVREALDKNIRFARSLHIETQVLSGQDAAAGLVAFARERKATQLYLSRPPAPRWDLPFVHDLVQKVSRLARDMELTIVAERGPRTASVR